MSKEMYMDLLRGIAEKRIEPGDRLPTERDFAAQYGTNRMAVHYVLDQLEKNRIISRQGRRGTFLKENFSLETVIRMRNRASRKILILSSESEISRFHWNQETIKILEKELLEDSEISFGIVPNNTKELRDLTGKLETLEIKALIIFPGGDDNIKFLHENLNLLEQYSGDMFIFDRTMFFNGSAPCHMLSVDFEYEGRLAARYVKEKGHRDVAFFYYGDIQKITSTSTWLKNRLNGVKQVLGDNIKVIAIDTEQDFSSLENFIRNHPKPAIIARTDENATTLLNWANTIDLKVKKDFSLISFDNNPDYRTYNLTTIAPPLDKIGYLIADVIRNRLDHHEPEIVMRYLFRSHIIDRETM